MLHIFDLDHTVYNGSTVRDFLKLSLRTGKLKPSFFTEVPLLLIRFLLGKGNQATLNRRYSFLKGIDKSELEDSAVFLFNSRFKKNLNSSMVRIIETLQKNREKTAVATSSFRVLVEPLTKHLKFDLLFATELEFQDNRTTGAISGNAVYGQSKKETVEKFLIRERISPEDCRFYSDSHRDLPLLEFVGSPVAVNPDFILARTAKKKNWEIIRDRTRHGRRK